MQGKFIIACCFLFLLLGCDNNDPDIIVNVEDDFYVDMFEDLSNGERRLEMKLTTIKEQDCVNYSIDYTIETEGILELAINDLVEPELCVEGSARAKTDVSLGELNNGSYSIFINLKDAIKNHGRLHISDEQYNLDLESDDGIEIINEILFRVPQFTLFGAIAFDSNGQRSEAEAFVETLQGIDNVTSIRNNGLFKSGYYGYFELDEEKRIELIEKPEQDHHIPLIFTYTENELETIRDLVESTCSSDLRIELRLANGQILDCD